MNIMNNHQKKITALAVLAVIWGGLLVWQFNSRGEPARIPLTNVMGSTVVSRQTPGIIEGLRVQLDLLAAARMQREMVFATPRNIFAPPAPSGADLGSSEPVSDLARQQAVAAELSQFHYLGYVRVGEEWQKKQSLAVLTKNDDLHIVKRGEMFDKHVLVKTITQESVTLQDRETHVEYTVLLSEEPVIQ